MDKLPLIFSKNRALVKREITNAELYARFPNWRLRNVDAPEPVNGMSSSGYLDGSPFIGQILWLDIIENPDYYFVAKFGEYCKIYDPVTCQLKADFVPHITRQELSTGVPHSIGSISGTRTERYTR